MDKIFLEAFSEIVRDEVTRKNEVQLEGVGSFRLEHRNQFQKQYENGRVVMMPPRDMITFTPEDKQRS